MDWLIQDALAAGFDHLELLAAADATRAANETAAMRKADELLADALVGGV